MKRLLSKWSVQKHNYKNGPTISTGISPDSSWPVTPIFDYRMSDRKESDTKSLVWHISGSLEIETKRPVESSEQLIEILGLIVDSYEGPLIKKPIVLAIYSLLGVHLKGKEKTSYSNFTLQASINTRVSFRVKNAEFEDSGSRLKWVRSRGREDTWFKITLILNIDRTKRPGREFIQLYENSPSVSFVDMVKELNISAEQDSEGEWIFKL